MNSVTSANFGLLIAYVLPGFVLLWGVKPFVVGVNFALESTAGTSMSIGDFLQTSIAAIAAGMTVSTIRWLVVDTLHHATGIHPPRWDFSLLGDRADAFEIVVEHYYRYYQFFANMFVSLLLVLTLRLLPLAPLPNNFGVADGGLLALMALFFAGSRDSLRRYYTRGGQLLNPGVKRVKSQKQK